MPTESRAARAELFPLILKFGTAINITLLDFTIGFFTVRHKENAENFGSFSPGPFFLYPNID